MKLPALLLAVVCSGLALAGCGSDSAAETRSEEAADLGPKPEIPQGPKSEKLIVKDLVEGDGVEAEKGDELAVHYVAGIYETGEEIESAWVEGSPLGFSLGSGGWLQGWEEGIPGMRVGGRRVLIIPTTRQDTPPGSELGDTLVYVVDLVEARKPEGEDSSAGDGSAESRPRTGDSDGSGPAPVVELPQGQPPNELVVRDLEVGKGRAAKPDDELEVYFTSFRYLTGEHFETIWKPEEPFDFKLNRNEVIPGWVEGLPGMKAGGRRYLEVPGRQAARGGISPSQDPDDSALVYVVDLLAVR